MDGAFSSETSQTFAPEGDGIVQELNPRVLVFSYRNIFKTPLFRCPHYEFEDVISEIDSVDLMAPQADPYGFRHQFSKRVGYRVPVALNPGIARMTVEKQYDVFFTVCGQPQDLLFANAALNWKDICKTSICLIDEFWISEMAAYGQFLRLLAKFDVVLLYYSKTATALGKHIGSKCAFLPPGVDTLRFCPYPNPPLRSVDVYSIGRRSESTHRSLLRLAENGLFYLHDSIAGGEAINPLEHRKLFANVAKRSRYFIVNPGLIDRPDIRGDQIEIGNRYFEGAASGTIMIGERPDIGHFDSLFPWSDAVIHLPYDSPDIEQVINKLDEQPEKSAMIRRDNVTQALLRHDWVYRWQEILETAGLRPMPQLTERVGQLRRLAETISPGSLCSRELAADAGVRR